MTRESVIALAAREISEFGEVCVDTYMQLTNYKVEASEVADYMLELDEQEEEGATNE